jgi:hypothetical protein
VATSLPSEQNTGSGEGEPGHFGDASLPSIHMDTENAAMS